MNEPCVFFVRRCAMIGKKFRATAFGRNRIDHDSYAQTVSKSRADMARCVVPANVWRRLHVLIAKRHTYYVCTIFIVFFFALTIAVVSATVAPFLNSYRSWWMGTAYKKHNNNKRIDLFLFGSLSVYFFRGRSATYVALYHGNMY